mmetsp:Transcript_7373/g.19179  ORF Transcript_7373/g.19179 Transcript_7373/m.19179 type:complete len:565 (+) Transcript_7373:468-2162(+)
MVGEEPARGGELAAFRALREPLEHPGPARVAPDALDPKRPLELGELSQEARSAAVLQQVALVQDEDLPSSVAPRSGVPRPRPLRAPHQHLFPEEVHAVEHPVGVDQRGAGDHADPRGDLAVPLDGQDAHEAGGRLRELCLALGVPVSAADQDVLNLNPWPILEERVLDLVLLHPLVFFWMPLHHDAFHLLDLAQVHLQPRRLAELVRLLREAPAVAAAAAAAARGIGGLGLRRPGAVILLQHRGSVALATAVGSPVVRRVHDGARSHPQLLAGDARTLAHRGQVRRQGDVLRCSLAGDERAFPEVEAGLFHLSNVAENAVHDQIDVERVVVHLVDHVLLHERLGVEVRREQQGEPRRHLPAWAGSSAGHDQLVLQEEPVEELLGELSEQLPRHREAGEEPVHLVAVVAASPRLELLDEVLQAALGVGGERGVVSEGLQQLDLLALPHRVPVNLVHQVDHLADDDAVHHCTDDHHHDDVQDLAHRVRGHVAEAHCRENRQDEIHGVAPLDDSRLLQQAAGCDPGELVVRMHCCHEVPAARHHVHHPHQARDPVQRPDAARGVKHS